MITISGCLKGAVVLGLALTSISGGAFAQAARPARSGPIAVSPDGSRVWVVNPDSNSVSVLETTNDALVAEIPVGTSPSTLAIHPDGTHVYVANTLSNDLSVLDASSLTEVARIPVGVQPYGVAVHPTGARLYVTVSRQGRVTVLDSSSFGVLAQVATAPRPRGLAISADGTRVVVTHFLTPVPSTSGTVTLLDGAANTVVGTVPLNLLQGLPGVTTFMSQAAVRPGSPTVWIPNVQAETGNPNPQLTTTVHASLAIVDFVQAIEPPATRTLLERVLVRPVSQAADVDFSPNGGLAFVVMMASDDLAILNAATRTQVALLPAGSAPQGVAVSPGGARAYVSNYLGRSVTVVNVNPGPPSVLHTVPVTSEPLDPAVANGKRLFFTSRGRMSTDNWIACISCHPHGGSDARDWNFTRLDEGIRNTTDVHGIGDTGAVHWSANMDELQDLEFNIRRIQFGAGLIDGTPNDPFGASNAGLSQELDDFAAFLQTLRKPERSNPNRPAAGGLSAPAARGKGIFESPATGCAACHRGAAFSDSNAATLVRHDVGTLAPGDIAGGSGFDTPSLRALWESAPYLHDGSAPGLLSVLTDRNPADRHGVTSTLTNAQRQDLVAYMLELDNDRDEMALGTATGLPGVVRVPLFARDLSLTRLNAGDEAARHQVWGFETAFTFDPAGLTSVTVAPAGPAAGLPVQFVNDPPADLVSGRKEYAVRFASPLPLTPDPSAPGEVVAWVEFGVGPDAAAGSRALVADPAGWALRNDDGSTRENPIDRTLLAASGQLTIGTPAVPDGRLGSVPLEVSADAGQIMIDWGAIESGGLPVSYNVYLGSLASLFDAKAYDHGCFLSGLAAPGVSFASLPGDSYFLVSARVAGWGEGSLGTTSSGAPIPNNDSCP